MMSQMWALRLQQNERELASAEGNLLLAGPGLKTLYVTSCFNGEGKTTAAVHLATGLAGQSDKRVLLVDGSTRSPRLHEMFGAKSSPGLTDWRAENAAADDLFQTTEQPKLWFLAHGDGKDRGAALRQMTALAGSETVRSRFDYLIFDGDSVLGSSQVSLVAQAFDGVLLAVACEKTKWEVVQQVREKVEQGGGQVLGVILNRRKYYIPRLFYGRK